MKTTKRQVNKPKASDHPSKLRHYRFAQKYVELNFNATQAYLATYGEEYKITKGKEMTTAVAQSASTRLLLNVMLQEYIQQITEQAFEECQISINSVLTKYKRWSESNITDVVEWKNINYTDKDGETKSYFQLSLRDMEAMPKEVSDCIESVAQGKDGFKVTLVSKKVANDMLFKYLGLDKTEKDSGVVATVHSLDAKTISNILQELKSEL